MAGSPREAGPGSLDHGAWPRAPRGSGYAQGSGAHTPETHYARHLADGLAFSWVGAGLRQTRGTASPGGPPGLQALLNSQNIEPR